MPQPSSRIQTETCKGFNGKNNFTNVQLALILLSMTSDIADSNVYPIERMEPIKQSAFEVLILIFAISDLNEMPIPSECSPWEQALLHISVLFLCFSGAVCTPLSFILANKVSKKMLNTSNNAL